MPRVGEHDVFEEQYRAKLESLLAPHGLLIHYTLDRASLDLGLHLYESRDSKDAVVGPVRVWFQAKGIHTTTMPKEAFEATDQVAIDGLPVDHVQFWYASAEPVYLAVFLEAVDAFLAEDVRDIVDRSGGMEMLTRIAAAGQKTMTLKIRRDARIEQAVVQMPRHRSIRIDGPPFRGRPLGHRYDPLRSELGRLKPEDFDALVARLLDAHDFRPAREIDIGSILDVSVGRVTAQVGTLYLTYEWTSPLFSEFGFGVGSDFRLESAPEHAQGEVLVVIHSDPIVPPTPTAGTRALVDEMRTLGVRRSLIFFNASEMDGGLFGGWRSALEPLVGSPQGLGSLAFNVLTATLVYLEFVDRLRWKYVNYI